MRTREWNLTQFTRSIDRDGAAITLSQGTGGCIVFANALDLQPQHVEVFELGIRVTNQFWIQGSDWN